LNILDKTIKEHLKEEKRQFSMEKRGIDLTQFQTIETLTEIHEIMQNYLNNETLLAQTWLDLAKDLKKKEEMTIEGDHFYYKNLHTFRVQMKNA
jgi:hypothetical protein